MSSVKQSGSPIRASQPEQHHLNSQRSSIVMQVKITANNQRYDDYKTKHQHASPQPKLSVTQDSQEIVTQRQ